MDLTDGLIVGAQYLLPTLSAYLLSAKVYSGLKKEGKVVAVLVGVFVFIIGFVVTSIVAIYALLFVGVLRR